MRAILIGALALTALAGTASAQTTQPELLQQTVAATVNPMAAWQASFSPGMVAAIQPLAAGQETAKNCKPVMVTGDKSVPSKAGQPLYYGTRCVVEEQPRGGLNRIAPKGVKTDVPSAGLGAKQTADALH